MATMTTPVQIPITGKESINDPTEPLYALSQFYRAFNNRDLRLMQENWDNSPNVSLDNPVGGVQRGWEHIHLVYQRIFQSPATVHVEFYDYTLHTAGELFYAVGRERGHFTSADKSFPLSIRTTRVFRLEDGRWRQVHHHGSIDDPQLLANYQFAVR